jgi:diacylglycerol kinase (ATP)
LRKFKPLKLNITADGSVIDSSVISVHISNGKYLFGGQLVAPKASMEDGLLDMMVLKNSGKIRHLINYSRIKKGHGSKVSDLVLIKASDIAIECPPDTAAKFDGEIMSAGCSYTISMSPKKLFVMTN